MLVKFRPRPQDDDDNDDDDDDDDDDVDNRPSFERRFVILCHLIILCNLDTVCWASASASIKVIIGVIKYQTLDIEFLVI